MITLRDVSKSYRTEVETVWAAREVNFEAKPGEFACIYGASGSGKSTVLNMLAGLLTADSGEIRVGDVDVSAADERRRAQLRISTVGVVFQDDRLIEEFTAAENVGLPLEVVGLPAAQVTPEAETQLERVGLAGLGGRYPRQLSGGQRQRVGVARALVGERTVLLGDEPTGALDSEATLGLFTLIRNLCDAGTLAVICSHDPRCHDFADSVYEMVDGRLAQRS